MKPMKPLVGIKAMEPMKDVAPWWPADLGRPASTGSQNGMRYAFFPESRRLIIEENGSTAVYDSGEHRIGGVAQADGASRSLVFTSQHGTVALDGLMKVG